MQELIPLTTNEQGSKVVSARDLYEFLKIKAQFTDWCKRMFEYGFEENRDYIILHKNVKNVSKSNPINYALTLDTAKEIAMLQRSEKGKQARLYFIECEKMMRSSLSPAELILQQAQYLVNIEKRQQQLEQRIHETEAKLTTRPEYFTIAGYATLNKMYVNLAMASKLGMHARNICKRNGYAMDKIPDPRFGEVNTYPKQVLKQVFDEYMIN